MAQAGMAIAEKRTESEPMTQILGKVREELQDIARRIDRNQALIARTTWHHGGGDADYMQAMQDADLNAQRVAALAGYLEAIAAASDPQWQVETATAISALTLADLARTMHEHAPAPAPIASKGDVELF